MNACKSFFSNFVTDYNSIFSAWWHIVSPYSATLCFQIARSLLSLQVVASRQTIIDPSLHQEFAGKLKSSPFFIAIDESNGKGLWQVLDHLCAIFHRSVTNQLPCHARLQHRTALYQTSSTIVLCRCLSTTTLHGPTSSPLPSQFGHAGKNITLSSWNSPALSQSRSRNTAALVRWLTWRSVLIV